MGLHDKDAKNRRKAEKRKRKAEKRKPKHKHTYNKQGAAITKTTTERYIDSRGKQRTRKVPVIIGYKMHCECGKTKNSFMRFL